MVHGTKTRPEAFLSARDTENMRAFLNAFDYVSVNHMFSRPDPSMYQSNSTIGDINITINQAEINNDTDIDKLAQRVGQAFTKELSRQGLNLAGYAM